jgi:hypothetical protein
MVRMNERIKELKKQATKTLKADWNCLEDLEEFDVDLFAELIVKECADAADMAHAAGCNYPGDYVGEHMGYGEQTGIAAWRTK